MTASLRSHIRVIALSAIAIIISCPHTLAADQPAPSPSSPVAATSANTILEIRSYTLKPGTRERFHQRFERESLPMLRRAKVDVVAYGPSLADHDSYFLMRAYPSLEERQRSEDAFYGSDEWRNGPRAAVLADIDTYTTVVIRVDAATLRALRK
jgi:hypothetical protein